MLPAITKMGFAGLLAAVLIGLLEQGNTRFDFDAVILSIEGVDAGVTLRWGIIGLATLIGQWVKSWGKGDRPVSMPSMAVPNALSGAPKK